MPTTIGFYPKLYAKPNPEQVISTYNLMTQNLKPPSAGDLPPGYTGHQTGVRYATGYACHGSSTFVNDHKILQKSDVRNRSLPVLPQYSKPTATYIISDNISHGRELDNKLNQLSLRCAPTKPLFKWPPSRVTHSTTSQKLQGTTTYIPPSFKNLTRVRTNPCPNAYLTTTAESHPVPGFFDTRVASFDQAGKSMKTSSSGFLTGSASSAYGIINGGSHWGGRQFCTTYASHFQPSTLQPSFA